MESQSEQSESRMSEPERALVIVSARSHSGSETHSKEQSLMESQSELWLSFQLALTPDLDLTQTTESDGESERAKREPVSEPERAWLSFQLALTPDLDTHSRVRV